MPVVIQTTGELLNTIIENDQVENREFVFPVVFTLAGQVVEYEFSLENQPGSLEIDPLSGIISGNLESLEFNGEHGDNLIYPEYDFRSLKGIDFRPKENSYIYNFEIVCKGKDHYPPQSPVDWEVSSPVSIKIIKDHSQNVIIQQSLYLDGFGNREPGTCQYGEPINEGQCNLIGGTWYEEGYCSLNIPDNPQTCQAIGAEWDSDRNYCNMQLIKTESECVQTGHHWEKNYIEINHERVESFMDFVSEQGLDEESVQIQEQII